MQEHTSSEFVEWLQVLQDEQTEQTKQDYYLAQIACEIHNFRQGFMKNPTQRQITDFLIPDEQASKVSNGDDAEEVTVKVRTTKGRQPIEPGPEAVEDPKWAKVNVNAKAAWRARLLGGAK